MIKYYQDEFINLRINFLLKNSVGDKMRAVTNNMNQDNESSKIVFESENFQRPARSFQMQKVVKNEKQMTYMLTGFIAVIIVVFIYLLINGGSKTKLEAPQGYKIIYPENEPPSFEKI